MAMFIVDRRLNPGSKSLENRQRFLRRAKALVQGAVKKTSEGRDIKDGPGEWRGLNPAGMESTNRMTLSCRSPKPMPGRHGLCRLSLSQTQSY